jgi:type VII secretion integral membrane protein EccD
MVGLARVTIDMSQRRVDLVVPEHVPIAELLPDLLRHAGEAVPDDGEHHGGWLLRRADGAALAGDASLHSIGVRDGEVLHLVPARLHWPEPEYDDVVETMAAAARGAGREWSAGATRSAGVVAAGLTLTVAFVVLVTSGPPWTVAATVGLGAAALLTLAGTIAFRGYRASTVGMVLAGCALPYAFAGGALLFAVGGSGPLGWLQTGGGAEPQLLVGSTAVALSAAAGAVGVPTAARLFAAGTAAGFVGAASALLAFRLPATGAAAVTLSALVCAVGTLPWLAIRLGRLPLPVASTDPPPEEQVHSAVRRTESLLSGMLLGHGTAALLAIVVLVVGAGTPGRLLALAGSASLLFRARQFVTVAHRVPLLGAGAAGLSVLAVATLAGPPDRTPIAVTALVTLALTVIVASATYSVRPPSPYVARAVDIIDTALVVSVIPIACAVLGLYARVRNLI